MTNMAATLGTVINAGNPPANKTNIDSSNKKSTTQDTQKSNENKINNEMPNPTEEKGKKVDKESFNEVLKKKIQLPTDSETVQKKTPSKEKKDQAENQVPNSICPAVINPSTVKGTITVLRKSAEKAVVNKEKTITHPKEGKAEKQPMKGTEDGLSGKEIPKRVKAASASIVEKEVIPGDIDTAGKKSVTAKNVKASNIQIPENGQQKSTVKEEVKAGINTDAVVKTSKEEKSNTVQIFREASREQSTAPSKEQSKTITQSDQQVPEKKGVGVFKFESPVSAGLEESMASRIRQDELIIPIAVKADDLKIVTPTATNSQPSAVSSVEEEGIVKISAVDQITRHMQTQYDGKASNIRITLQPESMGTIRIQLRQDGNEVAGVIEVQKSEIRKEIEQSIPQVLSSLQQQGIQIRKVQITQFQEPAMNARDQWQAGGQFDAQARQHFSDSPERQAYGMDSQSETQSNFQGSDRIDIESEQMNSEDGMLNMLI